MARLTAALVGLGAIARGGHLPGWAATPEGELVALADAAWTGPDGGVEPITGLPAYRRLGDLLDRHPVDVVDVCTPPSSHAGIVLEAIGRGAHVLCEKPLVLRVEELERLEQAARRHDRALVTVHNWRHAPILAAATTWVAAGRVGTVRRVAWEVLRTGPSKVVGPGENWRLDPEVAGGGILVDHGWHALYVLLGWMGRSPTTVEARLERRRHRALKVEDTAEVLLDAPGVRGRIHLTWAAEERLNRAEIEGDEGRIVVDDDRLVLETGAGTETRAFEEALSRGSTHPDWYAATLQGLLDEIRDPARRGENLRVAGTVLRVLDAAWRSDRSGGPAAVVARA